MFMKRNVGKEIETFSDPLPYPIIPIHFLKKSLENPSLFFARNYVHIYWLPAQPALGQVTSMLTAISGRMGKLIF